MEALDGDRSTMMSSFVKCWRNMGGGSLVYVLPLFGNNPEGSFFQAGCLPRQCKADVTGTHTFVILKRKYHCRFPVSCRTNVEKWDKWRCSPQAPQEGNYRYLNSKMALNVSHSHIGMDDPVILLQ